MQTDHERIEELEQTVNKIENYLSRVSRVGIPSGDLINAKLKALEQRVEVLEKTK